MNTLEKILESFWNIIEEEISRYPYALFTVCCIYILFCAYMMIINFKKL